MSDANRAFAIRWFEEVWNQARHETIDELMFPEGECHGFPEPQSTIGRDAFKAEVRSIHDNFDNVKMALNDIISEGDKLVVRWTATMNHKSSGKPVTLTGISITQLRDGKILHGWNALDPAPML